jgi:hypothetical protein
MMVALNVFALFVVAEEELAFIEGHKILPTTTRDYLQHTRRQEQIAIEDVSK